MAMNSSSIAISILYALVIALIILVVVYIVRVKDLKDGNPGANGRAGQDGKDLTVNDPLMQKQMSLVSKIPFAPSSGFRPRIVTSDGTLYVMVATDGTTSSIWTSTNPSDTTTWISYRATSPLLYSVTYLKGVGFVGCGGTGAGYNVWISQDGVAWVQQNHYFPGILYDITTNSYNQLVAVGASALYDNTTAGQIWRSTDGVTWTNSVSNASTNNLNAVTWSSVTGYVAVGAGGKIQSSPDGITWTSRTSGVSTALYDVVYAATDAKLWTCGASGVILSATAVDGSWTAATTRTADDLYSIATNGTSYIVSGATYYLTSINSGTTWLARCQGAALGGVVYGGSKYVVVNKHQVLSDTGLSTIIPRDDGQTDAVWNGVIYMSVSSPVYVAFGNSGKMSTSTDAVTWASATSGFSSTTINDGIYASGLSAAMIVGNSGTITSSTDGATWTSRTITGTPSDNLNGIAFDNSITNKLVIVGDSGRVVYSPAVATAFTSATIAGVSSINFKSVASNGAGKYVAVGTSSAIITSVNGSEWTEMQDSRTNGILDDSLTLSKVIYSDKFVLSSSTGHVWTSTNGTSWTYMSWIPSAGAGTGVVKYYDFTNSLYIAQTNLGGLLTSTDLKAWTSVLPETPTGRYFSAYFDSTWFMFHNAGYLYTADTPNKKLTHVYDGPCYAATQTATTLITAGSTYGTLLKSTDGMTFTPAQSLLYNIAGFANDGVTTVVAACKNAVFTSTDSGATWTQKLSLPPVYQVNQNQHPVVRTSDRFVVCGTKGYVATSTDGLTWTVMTKQGTDLDDLAFDTVNSKLYLLPNSNFAETLFVSDNTAVTLTPNRRFPGQNTSMVCNSGQLVAISQTNSNAIAVFTSTDMGVTWKTQPTIVANSQIGTSGSKIHFVNNMYVVTCGTGSNSQIVFYSSDLLKWFALPLANTNTCRAVSFFGGKTQLYLTAGQIAVLS